MRVTRGSQDPEAHHVVGLLGTIITGLGVTHQQVTVARQALEEYLAKIGPVGPLLPSDSRSEPDTTRIRSSPGRQEMVELEVWYDYHSDDGGSTEGPGNADELAEYVYMGNLSEIRAGVEVPIPVVRRGLQEFFRTGERPSMVRTGSQA